MSKISREHQFLLSLMYIALWEMDRFFFLNFVKINSMINCFEIFALCTFWHDIFISLFISSFLPMTFVQFFLFHFFFLVIQLFSLLLLLPLIRCHIKKMLLVFSFILIPMVLLLLDCYISLFTRNLIKLNRFSFF